MKRQGAAIAMAILTAGGCSTIFAVKEQQQLADTNCMITGTVATEKPARGPLVVGLFKQVGDDYVLVDYFEASKPGAWLLGVQPGTYWVAAFEDANNDGAYEDKPFYRSDPAHPLILAHVAAHAGVLDGDRRWQHRHTRQVLADRGADCSRGWNGPAERH